MTSSNQTCESFGPHKESSPISLSKRDTLLPGGHWTQFTRAIVMVDRSHISCARLTHRDIYYNWYQENAVISGDDTAAFEIQCTF